MGYYTRNAGLVGTGKITTRQGAYDQIFDQLAGPPALY